ncbi:histidine-rich glycoprotein-like [Patiria miniata]|uniref:Uncharacterized protein n=1 Tax=Patiria miniata TaxID=46514 RepID=A0A913ZNX4_PATMI|nr:histidine-rich glycoprotein-like [Patiria miniata]
MVQLGVTSPESQKEQELKKPIAQDVVVVTVPTASPAARGKDGCCTKRVVLGVAVVSILVALALGGTALGLHLRHRAHHRQCMDWGCGDNDMHPPMPYGDDAIYPEDYPADHRTDEHGSGDHDGDRHDGDRHDGDRHDGDRHDGDRHDGDRHDGDRHDGDRHDGDRHDGDRHDGDRHDGDRHDGDRHDGDRHDGDRHDGDHHDGDHHDGDRHGGDHHDGDRHDGDHHDGDTHGEGRRPHPPYRR